MLYRGWDNNKAIIIMPERSRIVEFQSCEIHILHKILVTSGAVCFSSVISNEFIKGCGKFSFNFYYVKIWAKCIDKLIMLNSE